MVYTNAAAGAEGLHGIGVFAPFVTADNDLKRLGLADGVPEGRDEYEQLALVETHSLAVAGLRRAALRAAGRRRRRD